MSIIGMNILSFLFFVSVYIYKKIEEILNSRDGKRSSNDLVFDINGYDVDPGLRQALYKI